MYSHAGQMIHSLLFNLDIDLKSYRETYFSLLFNVTSHDFIIVLQGYSAHSLLDPQVSGVDLLYI